MNLKFVRLEESEDRVTARGTAAPKQGTSSARRRRTRGSLPLLRLVWVAAATLLFLCPPSWGQAVDYWAPWVTEATTHSATVNWRAEDLGSGSVEYATSSYYKKHQRFKHTTASQTAGSFQHVRLTGLEPNTSYIYRVRPSDNPDVFNDRTFRTMPVSGPFNFIVLSDSHAQEKRFKYVADAIAAHETDVLFILDGGDYAGWDKEEFWTTYFQYADGMLAKFPIFHTIGNHEYHNNGHPDGPPTDADQYHGTFAVPVDGALNYSFDCSGIRFVVLNSPDPNNANGDDPHTSLALAESQSDWLKKQLTNNKLGTFTIHHHPIWDFGNTTMNPDLQPWEILYHTYGISATFAGHTHNYQRYSVEGIPYFVVGNAGGKFADFTPGDPYPVWYRFGETRQLGYLKVTVNPGKNKATAQEIFVAWVEGDDSETATVYDPPVIGDVVTFPLKRAGRSPEGSNSPQVSDSIPSSGGP
jgi:acid phosphatase type 7